MPTRIDWCDETINPLGYWCFGPNGTENNPQPCEYCYAKKIAKRKMGDCKKCHSFDVPHNHFERLDALNKWKKPKNIFIQSMGDLFHNSVPNEWIKTVLDACKSVPQHRYLFLTKNIHAYINNDIPKHSNFWYGQTWDCKYTSITDYRNHNINKFISIEPILSDILPITTLKNKWFDWVIVGCLSGNIKNKYKPEPELIYSIIDICKKNNTPIFLKDSIVKIIGEDNMIREFPW